MRGDLNTFGLMGGIVDQPLVFGREDRTMTMIKLARAKPSSYENVCDGEGIGCHRRLVLMCGYKVTDQRDVLEPLDPVEAMGYDDFR